MIADYFSFTTRLSEIRRQRQQLEHEEATLIKPILTDRSLIGPIYETFKEVISRRRPSPSVNSPLQRNKFVFIILCLYAPASLAGDKLPHRLRAQIADVTNVDPTLISHSFESVTFQYFRIKAYRQEMDYLYNEIESELERREIIKVIK